MRMTPGPRFGIAAVAAAGMMLTVAPRLSGQQPEPLKKTSIVDASDPSPRQGFSVVLLLGDMQGTDSPDTVPAAARRALLDVKDFLPYKAYKLLDTQWVLCCSGGGSAITRVRGVENEDYELEIHSFPEPASRLSIRFFLREPADPFGPVLPPAASKSDGDRQRDTELFQLERERLDLQARVKDLRGKVEVGMADPTELKRLEIQLRAVTGRVEQLKQQLNSTTSPKYVSRAVIDTSFRMLIGETVVVGTSRLKGGSKALIALLTAAARPKER